MPSSTAARRDTSRPLNFRACAPAAKSAFRGSLVPVVTRPLANSASVAARTQWTTNGQAAGSDHDLGRHALAAAQQNAIWGPGNAANFYGRHVQAGQGGCRHPRTPSAHLPYGPRRSSPSLNVVAAAADALWVALAGERGHFGRDGAIHRPADANAAREVTGQGRGGASRPCQPVAGAGPQRSNCAQAVAGVAGHPVWYGARNKY